MTHREAIKDYLSHIELKNARIIDWGSGSKPVSRYIQADERCAFTTVDNAPGIPDDRKGNAGHHNLDISLPIINYFTPFDIAFCMEVLEHLEDPNQAVANIADALEPGGVLYFSAPFLYPIHGDQDYWRFTDQGLKLLLERYGFETIVIDETVEGLGWIGQARKQDKSR